MDRIKPKRYILWYLQQHKVDSPAEALIVPQDALHIKYERLREILHGFDRIIVAYSGGVDSTLLLKISLDCLGGERVLACLGVGNVMSEIECEQAKQTAGRLGATLEIIERKELDNPAFLENTSQRCYVCKSQFFRQLIEMANAGGYDAVLSGSNADDQKDYRPGARAERECGIVRPLELAGLTKAEIRTLSRELSLTTWDKPSDPCLVTRIQYGIEITPKRLEQVERAESVLRELGFCQLRVRHHGILARIEVPPDQIEAIAKDDLRKQIVEQFKQIGFVYVSLDLQGFRSGSGNELLSL